MTEVKLTTMPGGGRGCGPERLAGGVYASITLTEDLDAPVLEEYLFDPCIRWSGPKFRGMQPAPEEFLHLLDYLGFDLENKYVVMDMIGLESYPTFPSWLEEGRRYGFSRLWNPKFDFSKIAGRHIWLAPIHWRCDVTWDGNLLPLARYKYCPWNLTGEPEPGFQDHYPECLFHLWSLATEFHTPLTTRSGEGRLGKGACKTSWGSFPLYTHGVTHTDFPVHSYGPGVGALLPLTHFEVPGKIPNTSSVREAGYPVVEVDK